MLYETLTLNANRKKNSTNILSRYHIVFEFFCSSDFGVCVCTSVWNVKNSQKKNPIPMCCGAALCFSLLLKNERVANYNFIRFTVKYFLENAQSFDVHQIDKLISFSFRFILFSLFFFVTNLKCAGGNEYIVYKVLFVVDWFIFMSFLPIGWTRETKAMVYLMLLLLL